MNHTCIYIYIYIYLIYPIFACLFSRDVFLFEIVDPPEARYPRGGQRTCFFEIFDPPEAR